jgi:hypothetical protein
MVNKSVIAKSDNISMTYSVLVQLAPGMRTTRKLVGLCGGAGSIRQSSIHVSDALLLDSCGLSLSTEYPPATKQMDLIANFLQSRQGGPNSLEFNLVKGDQIP